MLKCIVSTLLASLFATAAHAQIHIAAVGPMTGQYAAFGQQLRDGAVQATADLNAAGGVLGQHLVLDLGDDACDPKQAVSVANEMADRGVKLVAGHFCSGSSIPASHVYTDESIVQISPGSTSPAYTDQGAWNVFRTCGRDDSQGAVAGAYIAAHYPHAKIAILDDNSAYGRDLADRTRATLQAAGIHETLDQHFTAGEHDYLALASLLKQQRIAVIYIGGYHPETALIARQTHDQGMNAVIMGGDALVTADYWQIAGQAGQGTLMTFAADPRARLEAAAAVAAFRAHGIDPEGYVLYTYAAVQAWAQAATQAGTTDGEAVAAKLHGGVWHTVLGDMRFDARGDPSSANYVVYQWRDGQYKQLIGW